MKKQIIAVAVAGAVAGVPAIAAADVTLFGQFKYEVGLLEDTEGDDNLHHSYRGTRLGVKGSEDLGGGLEAIFQMRGNVSGSGRVSSTDFSFNEETWAGLRGGFGTLKLGRSDTAVKNASKPFRAFTDTLADVPTRPVRWQRADGIHYTTPNFGGFTLGATIEPTGDETDAYYAANVIYRNGPWYASFAAETQDEATSQTLNDDGVLVDNVPVDQGIADQDLWQVGAAYNYGMGTVGLQYQDWDGDVDVATLPVTFDVTPRVSLRASVQFVDDDRISEDYENIAVGAQYNFSNRTELFFNIWDNGIEGVGPTTSPNPALATDPETDEDFVNTSDGTQFGFGVRHSF